MTHLDDGTPEYEISDSICNSIHDEITRIKAMSDEEVCKNYQVDYKNEALIATVEFYHTGTGMTYNDYIEELMYRSVIDFDPKDLQDEIDTCDENEDMKGQIAYMKENNQRRLNDCGKLPPSFEREMLKSEIRHLLNECEVLDDYERYTWKAS